MVLFRDSRYADTATTADVQLVTTDGVVMRTLYRTFPTTGPMTVRYYEWREGDRLDRLAADHFGDPARWWEILDANPEINNGATIAPGTRVRLPNA